MRMGRQTDRRKNHDAANSRFAIFCESVGKVRRSSCRSCSGRHVRSSVPFTDLTYAGVLRGQVKAVQNKQETLMQFTAHTHTHIHRQRR